MAKALSFRIVAGTIPVLLCLVLCGCVRHAPGSTPRPQASYLHWLEKESLLGRTSGLVSQVSQSGRLWLRSGNGNREDILLKAAPNWLILKSGDNGRDYFYLARKTLASLADSGIRGLYLGSLEGVQDIWLTGGETQQGISRGQPDSDGDADVVALVEEGEKENIQIGSTLIGAATPRGPDFILQARQAGGHQGLYAMLPVPQELWNVLPQDKGEWQVTSLNEAERKLLDEAGILPDKLARDFYSWTDKGGWAATGAVMGMDGKARRWVYRYDRKPENPVFLWQDPSGAARQVFAAAIIRQTGLEGQALTGLNMDPILGLEPGDGRDGLEPGLEATRELSAQIHRYGGWAMFVDALPLEGIKSVLAGGCDFCVDGFTPLLFELALRTENALSLYALYKNWIKEEVPQSRLARGFTSGTFPEAALLKSLNQEVYESLTSAAIGNGFQKQRPEFIKFSLGLPGLVFVDMDQNFKEEKNSFLLKSRLRKELALARVIKVESPESHILVVFSQLPDRELWVTASNFSKNRTTILLRLPVQAESAIDMESGKEISEILKSGGKKFSLALDGLQTMNVVITLK